jgi:hypothetical protein
VDVGGVDDSVRRGGEIASAIFRTAFERWIDEPNERELPELIRESVAELEQLVGAP